MFQTKIPKMSNQDIQKLQTESIPANDAKISSVSRDESNQLHESEELVHYIADAAPVLIWISDTTKKCIWLNKPWLEFTGRTMEQEYGDGWAESLHPQDFDRCIAIYFSSFEARKEFSIEYRLRRHDGEYRWMLVKGVPRFMSDGEFSGYIGSCIDITERKQVEEILRQSQAEAERQRRLYDTILSNTPDLVYVFDLNHRFTYANDVLLKMWGKTWDEAIGKTCLELGYEPWHAEMHDREIEQVIATKQPTRGEVPFTGTFGRRVYDYIFVPIIGKDGEVEAIAGTTRDITERQQMEATLRETDRRKDEFLATLAHELRNPLAPIRSGLEIIRRTVDDKIKFEETLNIIERQTNQIVHLVDDLLDISRITQGKIRLRKERIDLKTAIDMALETSQGVIDKAENELIITLPYKPIYIDADLTRVAQIFLNILNNAAKYSSAGGKISLTAGKEGNEAVIGIKDTGLGIAPEMLSKIFDMFGQLETPDQQVQGGLGIGLSVVKKLVEMHGGTVEAFSEGRGKGSEFIVRLPLVVEQSESLSAAQSSEKDSLQTAEMKMSNSDNPLHPALKAGQQRVLVVDDNIDAVQMLETLLSFEGHTIRTAFDGKTGIEIALEFQPDVCLLDIGLPEMNGYELACRLREFLPQVLLISVSGWGQEEDRRRSREAGFDNHLVKPVDFDDIKKLIQQKSSEQS
jgi:PAS domain S-box-containing protein